MSLTRRSFWQTILGVLGAMKGAVTDPVGLFRGPKPKPDYRNDFGAWLRDFGAENAHQLAKMEPTRRHLANCSPEEFEFWMSKGAERVMYQERHQI